MQLEGLAIALYGNREQSQVCVTYLRSNGSNDFIIERTAKETFYPANSEKMRQAVGGVLREIKGLAEQIGMTGRGIVKVPTTIVYGLPEEHLAGLYSPSLRRAFAASFREIGADADVFTLLEHLFLVQHRKHGQAGSMIELHPYVLYLPEDPCELVQLSEEDPRLREELSRLYSLAGAGNGEALQALEGIARHEARRYSDSLLQRGIAPPRFIQFGLHRADHQANVRYTFLEWYNLKDIFVDELLKNMNAPHNICLKTPNDPASPPFSDICATHLADQWDLIQGRTRKRRVQARRRH